MKAHIHKDVIIAWANGAEIQYRANPSELWGDLFNEPQWCENLQYRVKPEREWPKSSLNYEQLDEEYQQKGFVHKDGLLAVAQLAIKQYIIDTEGKQ